MKSPMPRRFGRWLGSGLVGLLVLPCLIQAADLSLGRISMIQGQVLIQSEDAKEWSAANENLPIREGDRYWTQTGGRVEFQFHDGTVLRLEQQSSMDVLRLEEKLLQVHLGMGHLYFRSGRGEDEVVQFDLPDTSLEVRDRSRFRLDLAQGGAEEISIFRGSVEVASSGTKTRVHTGEMLTLEANSSEVSPLQQPDEWEQWNMTRDREELAVEESARHLPPELTTYADDLDENGEWIYVTDYGYCWRPRVMLSVDWAPYRHGRWAWIGGDYVWISYERWGWAPYHYGRWAWASGGWCWVPPAAGAVFWGPGFVGWIHTPHAIGWVPLGPGEIYYGRGHFGPHSIEWDEHHPLAIKTNYHYLSLQPSVTFVARADFGTLRAAPRPADKELLVPGRFQLVGHPELRPSNPPRIGPPVPFRALPAPAVRSINLQQIRERHPLLGITPPPPTTRGQAPERRSGEFKLPDQPRGHVTRDHGQFFPGRVAPIPQPGAIFPRNPDRSLHSPEARMDRPAAEDRTQYKRWRIAPKDHPGTEHDRNQGGEGSSARHGGWHLW